jgi:hypothetical protein
MSRKRQMTRLGSLCAAPAEGAEISELMRITGWKRTKLYRHLREHAQAGRAIQVSRGRWRADHRRAVTVSARPAGRPVPPLARASARKRAYTDDGTDDETTTGRNTLTPQPGLSDEE